MNKKIKIIELFVKIANEEEMPKKLKFDNIIWIYNPDKYDYIDTGNDIKLFAEIIVFSKGWLNQEVEILEDNTEEIKEIKGWGLATNYKDFETINHTLDRFGNKINELVKAVNEIRKEKNNV